MASESQRTGTPTCRSGSGGLVFGVVLILIGLVTLAGQLLQSDVYAQVLLLALGVIFLAWGVLARRFGLLVPGGVLLGIGAATVLLLGPFKDASDESQGGIFMLTFAAGWAVVTLASALFTSQTRLWPLVIAAVLAVIGVLLLVAPPVFDVLASAPYVWPVIMIAVGIYLLAFRREHRD